MDWRVATKEQVNKEIFRLRGLTQVCDEWPCAITQDGMSIDAIVDVVEKDGKYYPATETDASLYKYRLPVMIVDGISGIWPPRQSPRGRNVLEAWVTPSTFYPDDILGALILVSELKARGYGVSINGSPGSTEFECGFYVSDHSQEGELRDDFRGNSRDQSLPFAISKAYVIARNAERKI